MSDDSDNVDVGLDDEAAFRESLLSPSASEAPGEDIAPALTADASAAAPQQPVWLGKLLGHFKLLRLIGQGAMGFVVQALDINLHRIVALKILRRRIEGMKKRQGIEQFLREARGAAIIEHPNVVKVYEINEHNGWWYIAMEMVEGTDLRRLVRAAGPLSVPRACSLISDGATALAAAHELGIIHRDVKPSNLMINRAGKGKLTDFGFVRLRDPDDPFDFTDKSVGTPKFMAPEVVRHGKTTTAVDVYGLGATLYYALTGSPPYSGRTIREICKKHLKSPPPDVREHLPDCSAGLAQLIQRAMAKDPADRPSAAQMADALCAELIDVGGDGSGLGTGSSVLAQFTAKGDGLPVGDSTLLMGDGGQPRPPLLLRRIKARWAWMLAGMAVLALLSALAVIFVPTWFSHRPVPVRSDGHGPGGEIHVTASERLAKRFPAAPKTYGVRPPGAVPSPADSGAEAPPFSWVGKVDTKDVKFVASKRGRHFYPIDAPAARWIRLDDYVGYKTAQDARADGKSAVR